MAALDRHFPGLAFRVIDEQGQIRPHMNVFLGEEKVADLAAPIPAGSEIYIVGAPIRWISRLGCYGHVKVDTADRPTPAELTPWTHHAY